MKKSKVRKIIAWAALVAVFVVLCMYSVPVGITSVAFYGLGFIIGYNRREWKVLEAFCKKVSEYNKELLEGKIISITADSDRVEVSVRDNEKPLAKKTKKKAE